MSTGAPPSLGWRTDLIFARFGGQVADRGDVAIGVYESLGFRRGVSTWQFERPSCWRHPGMGKAVILRAVAG